MKKLEAESREEGENRPPLSESENGAEESASAYISVGAAEKSSAVEESGNAEQSGEKYD